MFAKGNPHSGGAKLVSYMMTGKEGERVEFGEARGFGFFHADPVEAARLMDRMAGIVSKADNPWFHTQTRLPADERLTRAQWEQVVDRQEKVLGFTGQPRIWAMHVNEATGERHLHVAWYRVDVERECVINPGLYKNKLKFEVSRYLEKQLGLRRIGNERQEGDRARSASRNEVEEGRRLGTDIRAIRAAILDCFEKSDSGRAFKAALEERGMALANADRRDGFLVIDPAGGTHALNKKLTGLTLAETRARLSDLDRAQLPGVEQAKEHQAERQAARDAQAARQRREHGRGAGERPAAARGSYAGLDAATAVKARPLGQTAGEIRSAWRVTQTAGQFAEQLESKGLILVYVSAEEAYASERASAFAKAINRRNRTLREGFAVIDRRGSVTRIDQRTTGDQWEEIQKRLGGIDRTGLSTVAEARATQSEANRAAFREKKEAERTEARRTAEVTGTAAAIRAAWNASRDPDPVKDARRLEEALAARGIGLALVGGEEAYASERHAALAKAAGNFAPVWREGEIVAIDGRGGVYRIDERTTGQTRTEIDARLATIDRAALMGVADTQEAMRAASLEAWKAEREQARPATIIEKTVADALRGTMTGTDFAAALDGKGLTIARATAADVTALEALRQQEGFDRASGLAHKPRHFAKLHEGDLAAVTRQGNVFRLSPQKLDYEEIGQRLADVQTRLPGVAEARALNEINREETIEAWAQRRAANQAARNARAEGFETEQAMRNAASAVARGAQETTGAAHDAVDAGSKAMSGVFSGLAKGAEKLLAGIFSLFDAPPKLTPEQAKRAAHEAEEQAVARAQSEAEQEKAAKHDWNIFEQDRRQQQEELERRTGHRDDGRERERERDRY